MDGRNAWRQKPNQVFLPTKINRSKIIKGEEANDRSSKPTPPLLKRSSSLKPRDKAALELRNSACNYCWWFREHGLSLLGFALGCWFYHCFPRILTHRHINEVIHVRTLVYFATPCSLSLPNLKRAERLLLKHNANQGRNCGHQGPLCLILSAPWQGWGLSKGFKRQHQNLSQTLACPR